MSAILLSLMLLGAAAQVQTRETPTTRLFVQTTPPGAAIKLDGKAEGTAPKVFLVPPGATKMIVEIELDGHASQRREVTIQGGRVTRIEFLLEPAPPAKSVGARRSLDPAELDAAGCCWRPRPKGPPRDRRPTGSGRCAGGQGRLRLCPGCQQDFPGHGVRIGDQPIACSVGLGGNRLAAGRGWRPRPKGPPRDRRPTGSGRCAGGQGRLRLCPGCQQDFPGHGVRIGDQPIACSVGLGRNRLAAGLVLPIQNAMS